MRTRRVLLHVVLATLTWSTLFGLLSMLRSRPTGRPAVMCAPALEVPATTGPPAPVPELVRMSSKDLRVKERTLTASADRDSIVAAVVALYRYHFCRLGEDATLQRLQRLLSRNRHVAKAQSRGGGCLDLQMKGDFNGTLMLYSVMPDCP